MCVLLFANIIVSLEDTFFSGFVCIFRRSVFMGALCACRQSISQSPDHPVTLRGLLPVISLVTSRSPPVVSRFLVPRHWTDEIPYTGRNFSQQLTNSHDKTPAFSFNRCAASARLSTWQALSALVTTTTSTPTLRHTHTRTSPPPEHAHTHFFSHPEAQPHMFSFNSWSRTSVKLNKDTSLIIPRMFLSQDG